MAPPHAPGPTPLTLPEGLRLGGCRLIRVIGRGGMGEVYEAIQESLNRRVAVKVLPPHLARDPAFIKRFERESDTLAQLSHPNLVAIYNRGHEGEHYYFILEYVQGKDGGPAQTLHQRLRSGEPLALGEASKLIGQIGEAVAYAHEKGVVHRDIKPGNILLDARGNARLLDFGIAHLVKSESGDNSRLTMTGEVLGTAGYVAPEQRDGKSKVDARADIYSCGALCYELLTGRLPEGAFELPSEAVPGLDASWDILVEKALQRNPDRRFQRMAEFVEAVRNTVVAPPGTPPATASVRPPPSAEARPPTAVKATPIVGQCPKCKTLNPGENRFCNECGTPMYEACPACKAENRVGTKYCGKCGVDVLKLKRLTQCRREAADLLSQVKTAPARQAKALLHDLRTVLTRLFADSPSDGEGQRLQAEAQAIHRDLLFSEAETAQAEASKELDPIPLFTQAYAAITEAQREFPTDAKVTGKLNEIKTALRVAFLDQASALGGSQAISLLQQMVQLFPDDADARARLDRLNAELAAIKNKVQKLLAEGHFGQALLDLATGSKKFPADGDLRLLQKTAQCGQSKLVKLAEDEIPLLCSERRFVRMLERIDELSKLRRDIAGLQDARDRALAALSEAEEASARGDAHLAAVRPQEALACYQKAKSLCSDYSGAVSGAEKAQEAMERLVRRHRVMKTMVRVLGTILLLLVLVGAWALLKDWRDCQQVVLQARLRSDKDEELSSLYSDYMLRHRWSFWRGRVGREFAELKGKALSERAAKASAAEKANQLEAAKFAEVKAKALSEWVAKASAAEKANQLEAANSAYDKALETDSRSADAWSGKGSVISKLGRYEEALKCYDKVVEIDPRRASAWCNKGNQLDKLHRYEEAVICFDKALGVDPRGADAWRGKGSALSKLGRFGEAITCLDQALRIDPQCVKAWTGKAGALNSLNRYEESIGCCDEALQIDPRYVATWNNKGTALCNLDRSDEALKCYDKAIEIDPRWTNAWYNKGTELSRLHRDEEALKCFAKTIEIDPRDADAWNNKGTAFCNLGRYDEALKCSDKAIEVNPLSTNAWYNKGAQLSRLHRYEEAVICFAKALEIDPRGADPWLQKGRLLFLLGRYQEAIGCFDKALEVDPRCAGAWSTKGDALDSLSRYEEAIACFDKALEIDPGHLEAWGSKGRSLFLLHRYEEAIGPLDKALEVDPRNMEAWLHKGTSLGALGRHQEAIGCFDKALKIDPGHAITWFGKAGAEEALKRTPDAIRSYRKFLQVAPPGEQTGAVATAKERLQKLEGQPAN